MGSPIVVLDSAILGRLSKPSRGPAYEPLGRNGLGARFLHLKGIGWGGYFPHRFNNGRRAFLGDFLGEAKRRLLLQRSDVTWHQRMGCNYSHD